MAKSYVDWGSTESEAAVTPSSLEAQRGSSLLEEEGLGQTWQKEAQTELCCVFRGGPFRGSQPWHSPEKQPGGWGRGLLKGWGGSLSIFQAVTILPGGEGGSICVVSHLWFDLRRESDRDGGWPWAPGLQSWQPPEMILGSMVQLTQGINRGVLKHFTLLPEY